MKSEIEFDIKGMTFWFGLDVTSWALPLFVEWNRYLNWWFFSITLLCLRFHVECWKDIPEETTLKELNNGTH